MKYVLIGIGSMGDVMPQLALAAELRDRGHRAVVIGLMPYSGLAASLGVDYAPVPTDTTALWPTGKVRRALALAQPGIMFSTMLRRFVKSAPLVNDVVMRVVEPWDVIVPGLVTSGAARLLGGELDAVTIPLMLAPLLPAATPASSALAPAHGGAALAVLGSTFMWRLSEQLAAAHTADMARRLGTRPVRPLGGGPVLMATSPTITPPSTRWSESLVQTGWIDPPAIGGDDPLGSDLLGFLAAEKPPVLMTFGTCPVVSPTRDVELFLRSAKTAGTRVVLQSEAIPRGPINDWAYNAPGVPHGALMRHVAAVVHHGGAGTTHAALAAGRPAMVVPHLGDQGYYARRVHALGAGPRGIPRWRLGTSLLTRQLRTLLDGESSVRYARAASSVARDLDAENGRDVAVTALEQHSGA